VELCGTKEIGSVQLEPLTLNCPVKLLVWLGAPHADRWRKHNGAQFSECL